MTKRELIDLLEDPDIGDDVIVLVDKEFDGLVNPEINDTRDLHDGSHYRECGQEDAFSDESIRAIVL